VSERLIRRFSFIAPSKGQASVTFHGHVICENETVAAAPVSFDTQIVDVEGASPNHNGPGGHRHSGFVGAFFSHSFILNATRVFAIGAAGNKEYFFKLKPSLIPDKILCNVFNATFSVVFVP
jgi:hypothetical protein